MGTVNHPHAMSELGAARMTELWWVLTLRGAVAIALGMIALLRPMTALFALVLVFAAYNVVEGLFSIIQAVRGARYRGRWWWPTLHAVVALTVAAVAILFPEITALIFTTLLIAWALINGILALASASRTGRAHGREWLIASGVVSLILAALLMAWPSVGLFTLTWMFACYALAAGISMLGLAFRLRWMSSVARGT